MRGISRAKARKGIVRLSFLVPAVFLLGMFVIVPVGWGVYISFLTDLPSQGGEFTGLDNYATVLTDRDTLNTEGLPRPPPYGTLIHNAIWIAIHLPLSLFLGLWFAIMLREVKGASIVKGAIFLGMVTPLIVGGVILQFIYRPDAGIVPAFFRLIGVESLGRGWLNHPETLLLGLIFGSVWLWTGFSLIVYSAGLTTIPKEYFEAARIDGASRFRIFRRITFPLLKPMTMVVLTMTVLWELKVFDIIVAATNYGGGVGGAADVLALQSYRLAFIAGNFPQAAVVATLLTLLTLSAAGWTFRRLVIRGR